MTYLILLNKSICQDYIIEASNINEAIYKLYQETEGPRVEIDDIDLFYTCAKEMKSIEGIIKLYNKFATYTIDKIYIVTAEIYNEDEEERKREARERFQSEHRRYQTVAMHCGAVDPLSYLMEI